MCGGKTRPSHWKRKDGAEFWLDTCVACGRVRKTEKAADPQGNNEREVDNFKRLLGFADDDLYTATPERK
jgi:hypothetical protein